MPTSSEPSSRFLRACARAPVDVTPVWMMRQAGRALPPYRELRKRFGFLELCERPDLMAEVTLMPLDMLGVDAAILFADIMLPLAALGVPFEIVESVGPVIADPIRSPEQVEALDRICVDEAVPSVFEAVRIVRSELGGRVPLIGFAGAPFTLACYLIEGRPSREFTKAKAMMFGDPDTWHALMDRLADVVGEYLEGQIRAGAEAVQLFDSWVGALGPSDADAYVMPYVRRILGRLSGLGVPRIIFGTNTATLLPLMAGAGCEVVGVDWRIPLDEAWRLVGDRAIQGNLDPGVLLGTPDLVRERVREVLRRAAGRPGHIFNLGHGVLPETNPDTMRLVVDTVHEWAQ